MKQGGGNSGGEKKEDGLDMEQVLKWKLMKRK